MITNILAALQLLKDGCCTLYVSIYAQIQFETILNLSSKRNMKYKHYVLTKVLARDSDTAFMTPVGL